MTEVAQRKPLVEAMLLPLPAVTTASETMANGGIKERGAIFTRREVVDFILDLCGYTVDRPLYQYRLLEPAFGHGDFLVAAVERLLHAYFSQRGNSVDPVSDLAEAIRAVEVHRDSLDSARARIAPILSRHGLKSADAAKILDRWIVEGDFLLVDMPGDFTHAVGNPPYVRQELLPERLMAEYRARYKTIYDRADIYVPFIERSLSLLAPNGVLGFICSDRWMKNKYGGPLRRFVSHGYHLRYYVDMVDTAAFHQEVIAYPAITVIAREDAGPTRVAHKPEVTRERLGALAAAMRANTIAAGSGVTEAPGAVSGSDPWLLEISRQLALVRRLESEFPLIEEAGCKVGIGVATGADRIFVGPLEALDVEDSRKLPLVTTKDVETGEVKWRGLGVINPFEQDGTLVDLGKYPKLARYFAEHHAAITARNCAKAHPASWYRTIDRIHHDLTFKQKLLIPDIKGHANVVFEGGHFYPHHNLYYIVSDEWNLHALQAVLMSGIARLFVATYSTRMRGGYLRFQAQYLRRIRLPKWQDVPAKVQNELIAAATSGDRQACNAAAFLLYRLTAAEQAAITQE